MIFNKEKLYVISTDTTSYALEVMETGHLEHLFYGGRIEVCDALPLREKREFPEGNAVSYSKDYSGLCMENANLEIGTTGKGDIREPFIVIEYADGTYTSDFCFEKAEIVKKTAIKGLPSSYDENGETESLVITLKEKNHDVELVLTYSAFEQADCIVKQATVVNNGKDNIKLKKLMSNQIDFDDNGYIITNFTGAWAREMNRTDTPLYSGKFVNESKCGFSSNRNNPFVMMADANTSDYAGECYGFNLIYSGNHYSCAEVNAYGKTRFVSGINPFLFEYIIEPEQSFDAPESVMTYSEQGYMRLSHNMHKFVREHIVRGKYKREERPVLINSWETAYFKFNEAKLLKLAKASKNVGIELFVLDDGWFGKRDSDNCSLGDWKENLKKLPQGLKGLSEKINELGMKFGIWVEPEMINEDSELYRRHPEYAVKIPLRQHSEGRNQMMLDLTRQEVRDYIINEMRYVFSQGNIEYVKWDMNRVFSDIYSESLAGRSQGEFMHRYILGLYYILDILTKEFPDILFESCASGGNRFDLGMMCYMPQVWASDNTDPICRTTIQNGISYGYPMSVVSAHVSSSPNHQTLRRTPLETRYNVAAAGILGYELNIAEMGKEETEAVKVQIDTYKRYRQTLQYGDYYRLDESDGAIKWITVSKDKKTAIGMCINTMTNPNKAYLKFRTRGLKDELTYRVKNCKVPVDIRDFGSLVNTVSPIHLKEDSLLIDVAARFVNFNCEKDEFIAKGSLLNNAGMKLSQGYAGTGFNDKTRIFKDYASRMYIFEA